MPDILSSEAQSGFWCFAKEVIAGLESVAGPVVPFGEEVYYTVLRKPFWVAPLARVAEDERLSRNALLALVRDRSQAWVEGKNNYIHVAVLACCDSCCAADDSKARVWCEIGRGFIMDDRWPQHLDQSKKV
jgi:hypothetical protein